NSSGQVQSNVPVTFSVNGSASVGSGTVDTNPSGAALTTVTDTTAQSVTVTASAAGVSNSATVTFNSATAGSIELTYAPQPAYAGQQETLTATVLNSSNQALADVPVTFSVNGSASVGSGTIDTNPSGAAQTTLNDSTVQSVTVTASAAGLSTSTTIAFNAEVGSIQLTYTPVPAIAGQAVTVSAAVYNSAGQSMANVPVTFGVDGSATIGAGPVDTSSSGIAQTTLNDATAQNVTVTADAPGFNASTVVQFNS
ncbi:MAG: Ig-like domain-containing protein, partial [Peptococcaceae bacterium]|nr:Ig-like domain-containing protein [Peptococcaceae bacterium]